MQSRPITTLLPIWTRKIAAEVIPGIICPLTWSINRPLTCGVWGDIFTVVLGDRARGLDFNETATLHYCRAYFNATLLGQIFRRMGLPPESLEFLTRGAKMSKPPLNRTLQNVPGLLKLLWRELTLEKDFQQDYHKRLLFGLSQLTQEFVDDLEPRALLARIDYILEMLRIATYYSIFAPLSFAFRQAIFRRKDSDIDNSLTPEVAALRSLGELAAKAKETLPELEPENVFSQLDKTPEGQKILAGFNQLLQRYGYLSDVGTDIAVPTWKEEPQAVKQMFVQLLQDKQLPQSTKRQRKRSRGFVQSRVDLKGRITEIYSRLLAELRWCFVTLEQLWLKSELLKQPGDIFFLELEEVRRLLNNADSKLLAQLPELLQFRRSQLAEDSELNPIPLLVYGNNPARPINLSPNLAIPPDQILQGIPASPGQVVGRVVVLRNLQNIPEINRETILVVPYTDSGWAPILARAAALISEAGGRLSHGAIVAREYGIPAVMDVKGATWLLQDGQQVRVDGTRGIVELSNDLRPEIE